MKDQYVEVLVKRIVCKTEKIKTIVWIFIALSFLAGIVFSMPIFYVATLILGLFYYFKVLRMDREYEYFYMDGEIDIAVIYNRAKRKHIISIKESEIELIAPFDSQEMEEYTEVKSIDCSAQDVVEKPYAIVFRWHNQRMKVLIQMNDELLRAFKLNIPNKIYY